MRDRSAGAGQYFVFSRRFSRSRTLAVRTYQLVEALGGSQTGRASTDDEDVNITIVKYILSAATLVDSFAQTGERVRCEALGRGYSHVGHGGEDVLLLWEGGGEGVAVCFTTMDVCEDGDKIQAADRAVRRKDVRFCERRESRGPAKENRIEGCIGTLP